MVKRLISANASEILAMSAKELKQSIKACEGRVILSENVAPYPTYIGDITNAEIARAFGADLILLNGIDVLNPVIWGLDAESHQLVSCLHQLTGRPIGVNLEPVDFAAKMSENRLDISHGRQVNESTIKAIETLGFDFVCLTGNPGTGVTNDAIAQSIQLVKQHFSGLIIAGKMHGAGVDEAVADLTAVQSFIQVGADIILAPAVGTVPGFNAEDLRQIVQCAHQQQALVMTAIGTSQESADADTIKQIAIQNKICGADIQHIGDAGYGGLAPVENIFAMSKAIRGQRHTISMIARSINR